MFNYAKKPNKQNIFQKLFNIILRSVSYSITVAINEIGIKKAPQGPQTFNGCLNRLTYINTNEDSFTDRMDYWKSQTGLELPAKHKDKCFAGLYHNMILEMESNPDISDYSIFDPENLEYINSDTFQNSFKEAELFYNGETTIAPYELYSTQLVTRGEGIIKAFLNACDNDTYQMSNINQLVLDYVNMVESERTISSENKELLQNCIILASYSHAYWKSLGYY